MLCNQTVCRVMTAFELQQEWRYRYEERLGILCGASEPDTIQIAIAKAEADAWLTQQIEGDNVSGRTHTTAGTTHKPAGK